MKLKVQSTNGATHTLEIATPLFSQEGLHLNRIVASDGTEYFFTKEGFYDGWGFTGKRH